MPLMTTADLPESFQAPRPAEPRPGCALPDCPRCSPRPAKPRA